MSELKEEGYVVRIVRGPGAGRLFTYTADPRHGEGALRRAVARALRKIDALDAAYGAVCTTRSYYCRNFPSYVRA